MWFVDCAICNRNTIGFDTSLVDNKRVCNQCRPLLLQSSKTPEPKQFENLVELHRVTLLSEYCPFESFFGFTTGLAGRCTESSNE